MPELEKNMKQRKSIAKLDTQKPNEDVKGQNTEFKATMIKINRKIRGEQFDAQIKVE